MIYSRSLQKKGNCIDEQMNVSKNNTVGTKRCIKKKLSEKEVSNTNLIYIKHNSYVQLYLLYPVDNRCPCMRMFFQYSKVCKHGIPFRAKLIVPEEVSDQLWSCILEDSSATVNYRSTLIIYMLLSGFDVYSFQATRNDGMENQNSYKISQVGRVTEN